MLATANQSSRSPLRLAISVFFIALFLFLIWSAARTGFASLLTAYADRDRVLASADAAIRIAPTDPETHFVRAEILEANNNLPAAMAEYNQATALRPDDYVLWLSLAHVSELSGDQAGAINAARKAVALAPYYAQPHWQLGNILLRAGHRDEGFHELGFASESNPSLMPSIIDLAWHATLGDAQLTIAELKPQRAESFQALGSYLKKQGQIEAAITMFKAAGDAGKLDRRAYLSELMQAGHFKEAYELWRFDRTSAPENPIDSIINANFEEPLDLNEIGFDWRNLNKAQAIKLSLDLNQPENGNRSLRADFSGDSDPALPFVTQLILIQPRTHYRLQFSLRTEELVSGGPPHVYIFDAANNRLLNQSAAFPRNSNGWLDNAVDFISADSTAIIISVERERCAAGPCPIFGRLWLDNFSLQKL